MGRSCDYAGDAEPTLLGIDYVKAYHCTFGELGVFFYPALLGWACFLTYLLGHTADAYFSPTLAAISDKLELTYDVAGVTFLALGNGAPDVFSSIAAFSSKDSSVVLIGLCELLGASVFITTVVVGSVIILHPASVQPQPFVRDIVFQVLANVLLTITAIYGRVTVTLALGYLLFYGLYVLVVLYLDRVKQASKQPDGGWQEGPGVMSAFWLTPSDIVDFDRHAESSAANSLTHDFLLLEDEEDQHREQMGAAEAVGPPTFAHRTIGEYFNDPGSDLIDGSSLLRDVPQGGEGGARSPQRRVNFAPFSTATTPQEAYEATGAEEDEDAARFSTVKTPITSFWDNLYWQQWRTRRRLLRQWRASEWADKTRGRQVMSLVELPLILLRNWTIPAVEEESWSRATATLYPLCAPVFLMFVTGTLGARVGHVPVWSLVLVVGSMGSILIHLGTHESRPPTSFGLSMGFIVVAFIMCSAWIYTIATELVAVIEAMGTLCGIPPSLLGLTLLAWGNSVGDLITNIAVAKAGLSNMAIAGCFAGPTFNLLVGMGLSFLWKALKVGPFDLQLDESAVLSLVFLYVGLGLNLIVAYLSQFKLGRTHALALFGLYGACTLIQVCLLFSRAATR